MATPCIPNKIPDWQRGFTCSKFKFVIFGRPSWFLFWEINRNHSSCKRQHIWWIVWFPQELCHNLFSRIICHAMALISQIESPWPFAECLPLRLALPKHFFLSRGNHEVPIWSLRFDREKGLTYGKTLFICFSLACVRLVTRNIWIGIKYINVQIGSPWIPHNIFWFTNTGYFTGVVGCMMSSRFMVS